jgi:mycothiol S-conjugate amidase
LLAVNGTHRLNATGGVSWAVGPGGSGDSFSCMAHPRCLLTVHAHPDDEASKGASTVARYKAEGVRTVLVTCTGGEEGDILNPAMDNPSVRERLIDVRKDELALATKIIGYDEVVLLGYRDSGMPETEANARPEAFANADFDEAVGRLVEVIRRERPQVVITYADDQQGYPHPDHLMVHDISVPAFDRAGDPDWYPDAGEPWTPTKLYYTVWSRQRMLATHEKMVELGVDSPFDEKWFERPSHDHRITTRVPIGDWFDVRLEALLAHATQVDPSSPFWFGLPREVARTIHPFDDYILAQSRVETDLPEEDLFAGLPGR